MCLVRSFWIIITLQEKCLHSALKSYTRPTRMSQPARRDQKDPFLFLGKGPLIQEVSWRMLNGRSLRLPNILLFWKLTVTKWKEDPMESCGHSMKRWENSSNPEISGNANPIIRKMSRDTVQFQKSFPHWKWQTPNLASWLEKREKFFYRVRTKLMFHLKSVFPLRHKLQQMLDILANPRWELS